jgi:hypothetical protein
MESVSKEYTKFSPDSRETIGTFMQSNIHKDCVTEGTTKSNLAAAAEKARQARALHNVFMGLAEYIDESREKNPLPAAPTPKALRVSSSSQDHVSIAFKGDLEIKLRLLYRASDHDYSAKRSRQQCLGRRLAFSFFRNGKNIGDFAGSFD